MTQEVLSSADDAPPRASRPSFRLVHPKWHLLTLVLISFLAGMCFTNGLNHLATAKNDYRSYFVLTLVCLLGAMMAAWRYLRERPGPRI